MPVIQLRFCNFLLSMCLVQIFHMVDNPLQQAHNLLLEEERTRKRKASGNLPEECEAKRYQEEEMTALRRQLERTEKERETQQKIHEDTLQSLKKFRFSNS